MHFRFKMADLLDVSWSVKFFLASDPATLYSDPALFTLTQHSLLWPSTLYSDPALFTLTQHSLLWPSTLYSDPALFTLTQQLFTLFRKFWFWVQRFRCPATELSVWCNSVSCAFHMQCFFFQSCPHQIYVVYA